MVLGRNQIPSTKHHHLIVITLLFGHLSVGLLLSFEELSESNLFRYDLSRWILFSIQYCIPYSMNSLFSEFFKNFGGVFLEVFEAIDGYT